MNNYCLKVILKETKCYTINLKSYLIVVDCLSNRLSPSLGQTALNAELYYVRWPQYLKYDQIMAIIAQM